MDKKTTLGLLFALALPSYVLANTSAIIEPALQVQHQSILQEGREYSSLTHPVVGTPKVVEFFSFYCGPCYQFVANYPVTEAINSILPPDQSVVKYHVSMMGPLGNELTEAWAIAMVMGKTKEVETLLFEAVHNQQLKNMTDIQVVFAKVGIDTAAYQQAQQSLQVKDAIAQQNAAIESFSVTGTPTFYINGKYKINNAGITAPTPQTYVNSFAQIVQTLIQQ